MGTSSTNSNGSGGGGGVTQNVFTVDLGAQGLAIDKSGNVWVASYGSGVTGQNVVTELSPTGSILGTTPVDFYPCCMAIDSTGNIWAGGTPVVGGGNAVAVLNPSGTILKYYFFADTIDGITNYDAVNTMAIDQAGNHFFAAGSSIEGNTTVATLREVAADGVTPYSYNIGPGNVSCVTDMTIDAQQDKWFATLCGNYSNSNSNSNTTVYELGPGGQQIGAFLVGTNYDAGSAAGIAVDKSGNIWVTNPADDTVTKLIPGGPGSATVAGVYPTIHTPSAVAIDGAGNVWVGGTGGITELNSSGTAVQTYTQSPLDEGVERIVIDASGNVWATSGMSSSGTGSTVVELTGAATGPQYFAYSGPQWP